MSDTEKACACGCGQTVNAAAPAPCADANHVPTDDELFELFAGVRRCSMRHGGRAYHRTDYEAATDPRSGQGRVLLLLKSVEKISQSELARIIGIRPQSLSGMLSKLEEGGYVTRTPNPDDHRAMDVAITDKGRAAQQQPRNSQMLEVLDDADRRDLYRVLTKINGFLKERVAQEREAAGDDACSDEHRPGRGPRCHGRHHDHHGDYQHFHGYRS
ncbi:MAG: MarR family transcriptional regulator [Coriobacteriia bacterium]|nr:MarR family transcriptional regulator [Coriobacteriia bacterium]MBS5478290.1 MarR family transcriptional regulator [Coriobacteriia bacterium]